jgi:hypothetical protein
MNVSAPSIAPKMPCMKSSVANVLPGHPRFAIAPFQWLVQPPHELLILARIRDEDSLRSRSGWSLGSAGIGYKYPKYANNPLSSRLPGGRGQALDSTCLTTLTQSQFFKNPGEPSRQFARAAQSSHISDRYWGVILACSCVIFQNRESDTRTHGSSQRPPPRQRQSRRRGRGRRLAGGRGPECLGLTGRLATSLIFFFTFHFQESELVRGVTHYAQPTTDISMP